MRNYKLLLVWLVVVVSLVGCDIIPNKPNFTTSHKVEAPILFNKTFQLLGGGEDGPEALLDTTKGDFDSLFTVIPDGDDAGLITISRTEEFDFGDLNDAIPAISADPTSFSSEVGEIELGSFSSGSGALGTASFQDLTGLNPSFVPTGTPIIAGTTPSPVNIGVGENTDFFVSATIKDGALELGVTNNLGFDISAIDIVLNSGSSAVGSTTLNNVNHGVTITGQIPFSDGDVLEDINVDVSVSWNAQNTQAEPGELVVEEINGVGLIASAVEAAVTPQDFSTSSTTTFDATEFQFTSTDHYVELESGTISIAPIVNDLDLTVESLVISFPGILAGPNYNPEDSLVISYTGADRIFRSDQSAAKEIDLAGYRIKALNNEISYNISALTEDTQDPSVPANDQTRVITETDQISSSVEITNLKISSAFGVIAPQSTLLGDDDPDNNNGDTEVVDLFNETEVSLTEIDGLEDLSSEIDGIEFADATLSISYTSNIGISTTIYAAILGVNGEGEEVYLKGNVGSDKEVVEEDSVTGIYANGVELDASRLIKFELEPSPDGSTITSAIVFDASNTNVNDFLNNLPNDIRFVGKSVINKDGGAATIATPLEFDPTFLVDLPVYFSADGASYTMTEEVTAFEDFPTPEDDLSFTNGELIIGYKNGLPFGVDIAIDFIRPDGSFATSVPMAGDDPLLMDPAQVDDITRFVNADSEGELRISMDLAQLQTLYEADSLGVTATLNTFNTEAVKLRDTDSITISISGSFSIENKIGKD